MFANFCSDWEIAKGNNKTEDVSLFDGERSYNRIGFLKSEFIDGAFIKEVDEKNAGGWCD